MTLSGIVAVALDNAIGVGSELPWHLPLDLKFFKQKTLGKPVLMGRKTFDSLGKPLPGRLNIVVSSNRDFYVPEGVLLFNNLQSAISRLEQEQVDEAFVIGGGRIFAETMDKLDRLYITRVNTKVPKATAFFPELDHSHWKIVWEEHHESDEKHAFPFSFQQLERMSL
ncbi:MAG: dihydrofolate reductase [Bacteroidetes bacterium]|nr:dihydrofolate reductase [Bacteroidota bacterium]MBS1738954.1 dihydrofolate reductase [Bacteroidota bacterium]